MPKDNGCDAFNTNEVGTRVYAISCGEDQKMVLTIYSVATKMGTKGTGGARSLKSENKQHCFLNQSTAKYLLHTVTNPLSLSRSSGGKTTFDAPIPPSQALIRRATLSGRTVHASITPTK